MLVERARLQEVSFYFKALAAVDRDCCQRCAPRRLLPHARAADGHGFPPKTHHCDLDSATPFS
jgi:hypothetical protein